MKRKILLLFVMVPLFSVVYAQKNKKTTAYAITGVQKGQSNWTEVRLIDINTGEEVQSVYQSKNQVEVLNARTGKPVVKKDAGFAKGINGVSNVVRAEVVAKVRATAPVVVVDGQTAMPSIKMDNNTKVILDKKIIYATSKVQSDKPFATNSAACAYDKKHERLYYTPMGINQLRYIDLKSNNIYYFEDEPFGALRSSHDIQNQITRMVIASDGNGYALTNDGNHLIRFTTGKKPEITDLGALTDDAANGNNSIHSSGGYGGDMIADTKKNLYLITANRVVYKIGIENKTATSLGAIKGLPKGFSTNGAVVDEGTKVIVSSSNSTQGYYRFDLTTLESEKVSTGASVFNASDLANGTLANDKKKKEKKQRDLKPEIPVVENDVVQNDNRPAPKRNVQDAVLNNNISVFPNPVSQGYVKLSFNDQPAGKYQVQLLDISGKLIKSQQVIINNKVQVEEFRLPELIANGNYLVKIISADNKVSVVNKIIVQ